MSVGIVTDSSCALTGEEIRDASIHVVDLPVTEHEGDRTTSGATPAAMEEVFRGVLAEDGVDAVVAVHLSSALSVTLASAKLAAEACAADGLDVRVVDSKGAGMGLGLPVLEAAASAAEGNDVDVVAARVEEIVAATRVWLFLDTLDALRRGGRIGAAAAFLSSALAIKPVLTLRDGRLAPIVKTRTAARALEKLSAAVVGEVGTRFARVCVHHCVAPEHAREVADGLESLLPAAEITIREIPEVLAVHLGEKAIAVSATIFDTEA